MTLYKLSSALAADTARTARREQSRHRNPPCARDAGRVGVYFPIETWASWGHDYWLLNPFYLIDLIAMGLLLYGAIRSLRARPRPAPGALCAAFGWTAANGWRATWGRAFELRDGGHLDHGLVELWVVGGATLLSLLCLAWSFYLMVRADAVPE